MRKALVMAAALVMLLSALTLTSCGKPVFTMSENTEKAMTIEAKNAAKGDFFAVGTLVVDEGEQVSITSNLEKGSVKVDIIAMPAEQSMDELPETDGEPVLSSDADDKKSVTSGTLPAGDYMVKAAVAEKATGTVDISVTAAE